MGGLVTLGTAGKNPPETSPNLLGEVFVLPPTPQPLHGALYTRAASRSDAQRGQVEERHIQGAERENRLQYNSLINAFSAKTRLKCPVFNAPSLIVLVNTFDFGMNVKLPLYEPDAVCFPTGVL